MYDTNREDAHGHYVRCPGWLIEGHAPLGTAGFIGGDDHREAANAALDLAIKVASAGDDPQYWRTHLVVARGVVVAFCGEDVHRYLAELDPDGSRRLAAAGRLFTPACLDLPAISGAAGTRELVARDGVSWGATSFAADVERQLRGIKNLKLVILSPMTGFLPSLGEDPECFRAAWRWLGALAEQTGAAVIACVNHVECGRMLRGSDQCR